MKEVSKPAQSLRFAPKFKVEGFRRRCPFTPLVCLSCEQSLFVFRTQEHFQAGTEPRLSLLSIYLEQKGWMSRECTQSGLQKPSDCFMRLLFHPCRIPAQPSAKKKLVTSTCEHSHMAGGTAWLQDRSTILDAGLLKAPLFVIPQLVLPALRYDSTFLTLKALVNRSSLSGGRQNQTHICPDFPIKIKLKVTLDQYNRSGGFPVGTVLLHLWCTNTTQVSDTLIQQAKTSLAPAPCPWKPPLPVLLDFYVWKES